MDAESEAEMEFENASFADENDHADEDDHYHWGEHGAAMTALIGLRQSDSDRVGIGFAQNQLMRSAWESSRVVDIRVGWLGRWCTKISAMTLERFERGEQQRRNLSLSG